MAIYQTILSLLFIEQFFYLWIKVPSYAPYPFPVHLTIHLTVPLLLACRFLPSFSLLLSSFCLLSSLYSLLSLRLSSFCLLSSLYSFLSLQVYVFILSSTVFEPRHCVIMNNNDLIWLIWFDWSNRTYGSITSFQILSSFQRLLPFQRLSSSFLSVVSIPPLSRFSCFFHPSNCISSSSDLHP